MGLDGPRLPDGRHESRDADLDEGLVIVVGEELGLRDDVLNGLDGGREVVDHVVVLEAEQVAGLSKNGKRMTCVAVYYPAPQLGTKRMDRKATYPEV